MLKNLETLNWFQSDESESESVSYSVVPDSLQTYGLL